MERKLIVVTGKGGVGKTTIAGSIGLLAAQRGLRTLVLDVTGASRRLVELFAGGGSAGGGGTAKGGTAEGGAAEGGTAEGGTAGGGTAGGDEWTPADDVVRGEPTRLADGLWSMSLDPDAALVEWMQELGGRMPARVLASKTSFQYFTAAAPGAKELVCMVKVCRLASGRDDRRYDLVVLDAPATGHALAMLGSPRTYASIARVGPVATQAEQVRQMLQDPAFTGYVAVSQASEMAVSETIELQRELHEQMGVDLSLVIVNATMHRRFTGEEMQRIASLRGEGEVTPSSRVAHAAAAAAHAAHSRTRFQHSQIARLRRQGLSVMQVPFVFQPDLDLDALERIAQRLQGKA